MYYAHIYLKSPAGAHVRTTREILGKHPLSKDSLFSS